MDSDSSGFDALRNAENMRAGYQAAIALWAYEATTIWAKFTMVSGNTILIATLGLMLTSDNATQLAFLALALAVLGCLLCIVWVLITLRSFDFQKHWILSARELELHLPPVRTVMQGGLLGDQQVVNYRFDPETRHRFRTSQFANVENLSYFVIGLFVMVYVAALYYVVTLVW